jgi:tetratricopeptide (TPR) repeat protein
VRWTLSKHAGEKSGYIHSLLPKLILSDGEKDIGLESFNVPPLKPERGELPENLNVGTIEVGNTRFSLEGIITLLRYLWPFGGVQKVISGSVQTFGKKMRLVIKIESGNEVNAWEVTDDNFRVESLTDSIRDLAYKASLYLAPYDTPQTWEGFKHLTESISQYAEYRRRKFAIDAHVNQASSQYTENIENLQKAIDHCLKAIEVDGQENNISIMLYYLSILLLKDKKYLEAENLSRLAIQINPSNKYFHNALGNILWRQMRYDAAMDQYILTKTIDPDFPYAYNGLGNLHYDLGEYEEALTQYGIAIQKKPDFWKPFHNRGTIYLYHKNDLKNAEYQYQISKKKSYGKVSSPYSGLGLVYLFRSLKAGGQERQALLEKAKIEMQQAIDRDSNSADSLWNLGLIQLRLGQLNEVYNSWQKASLIVQRQEVDKLCIAVYRYAVKAIPVKDNHKVNLDFELGIIQNLLATEKFYSRKGKLKIFLSDINLIADIKDSKFRLVDIDQLLKLFQDALIRQDTSSMDTAITCQQD